MYWEDIATYILVVIFVLVLIIAGIGNIKDTEKRRKECEKNGGTIIETYKQDICITKDNIEKIRGIE